MPRIESFLEVPFANVITSFLDGTYRISDPLRSISNWDTLGIDAGSSANIPLSPCSCKGPSSYHGKGEAVKHSHTKIP